MEISPDWQARIIAYRALDGLWYTPEAVQFERARKAAHRQQAFDDALPYTWEALVRRYEYGRDVPEWVINHLEVEAA